MTNLDDFANQNLLIKGFTGRRARLRLGLFHLESGADPIIEQSIILPRRGNLYSFRRAGGCHAKARLRLRVAFFHHQPLSYVTPSVKPGKTNSSAGHEPTTPQLAWTRQVYLPHLGGVVPRPGLGPVKPGKTKIQHHA
jgi:hypothetical protein